MTNLSPIRVLDGSGRPRRSAWPRLEQCIRCWLFTAVVISGIAVSMTWFFSQFGCHRGQSPLTACKSNLKNAATALEMYASDNGGLYPRHFHQLVPNYMQQLPTCPASGYESYVYWSGRNPDNFTLLCGGDNHQRTYASVSPGKDSHNYPQYSAEKGLADHP